MAMWDAVEVAQFRRLQGLKLEGLRPINVLVGPNNCGKTSVLEALAILCNPLDSANWVTVARNRGDLGFPTQVGEIVRLLFPQSANTEQGSLLFQGEISLRLSTGGAWIPLSATLTEARIDAIPVKPPEGDATEVSQDGEPAIVSVLGVTRSDAPTFYQQFISNQRFVRLPAGGPPLCPHRFVSPSTHRNEIRIVRAVSDAVEKSGKQELVRLLKLFDSSIENLEIVSPSGRYPVVKLWRQTRGFMPLLAEGDGVRRALALAASAFAAAEGILLLDELETAFHIGVLSEVMQFLLAVCQDQQVQVFATTHSLEALDGVLAVEKALGHRDRIAVYRLPSVGSPNAIKRLSGPEAMAMRTEDGFDLR